jgi:hydrogenase-4 component B
MIRTVVWIAITSLAVFWLLLPMLSAACGRHTNARIWSVFVALGAVSLAAAAICGLFAGEFDLNVPGPISLGGVRFELRFTPLSDAILLLIAFISLVSSLYLRGYMQHLASVVDMRVFWIAYSLLLLSMSVVVLSGNVLTFLLSWELMSLSSFFLVATSNESAKTRNAALIYLAATRLGTALLAGGFLWAHCLSGSWDFSNWHFRGATALGPGLLILAGLGVKAGMWPFHLWLPIAHPVAPAPVSAIMSGVMVKIAVFMIIRLFVVEPADFSNTVFGYSLIALGATGVVWGILFALVQQDLKRMLALSTVENVGLILVGLGASIVTRRFGLIWASELALAGALYHLFNHAVFKSLLFLGAGAVDVLTGTRKLDLLGGLGHRMPATYACFLVGAASMCAIPPLSGFSSEWVLYQSALAAAFGSHDPLIRFAGLLAITGLAAVGSLVCATMVRTIGIAFQGRPRSKGAATASEASPGMCAAQIALSVACLGLGICAPIALRCLQSLMGHDALAAVPLSTAWTVPLGSTLIIAVLTALVLSLWLHKASQTYPTRQYVTWDCGFGAVGPRVQATSISFAQPMVRMFGALFNYAQTMEMEGLDSRLFPLKITSEAVVDRPLEHHVYRPFIRWFGDLSETIVNLQHGSIHRHLLTMLLTLIALLIIGGYLR